MRTGLKRQSRTTEEQLVQYFRLAELGDPSRQGYWTATASTIAAELGEQELVEHAQQNAAERVAEVRARMSPFAMQERLAYASFMAKIIPSGVAPLFIKQAHDLVT
jgi:hypothetical protein